MCLRQPFQLLTSSPVPVKDNTCNKNENETFAAINEKEAQTGRKKERKKDGNRQPNKVTNTCMIHQGTKGTPYHRTWENCARNGVSRHTKNYNIEHSIKRNRHAKA